MKKILNFNYAAQKVNQIKGACKETIQKVGEGIREVATEIVDSCQEAGKSLRKVAKVAVTGTAIALVALTAGCEKNPATGDFNQGTSAGVLAEPSCETIQSVPVDANDVITIDTLTNDRYWKLDGVSYVDAGKTLYIEPGTKIITGATKIYDDPAPGVQSIAGVLVVPRNAKLHAQGTPTQPIVFTTAKAIGCESGCSAAGNFGGIVIIGNATTNRTSPTRIEGIPLPLDPSLNIFYGGPGSNVDNDDSGILEYVRIEFPGYRLDVDNEINGLTLGGVGTGTTLSHIQVSYSADDAFEFFGGTVNADHLVAIGTDDDDYDFDHGYTGTIEFAIGLKDPGTTNSTSGGNSDSNGIESDNDGTGTGASPQTAPTLSNFTLLGYNTSSTKLRNGSRWRRGSGVDIQKSIIGGFPNSAALFESAATIAAAAGFTNNVVHGFSSSSIFLGASPAGNIAGSNTNANLYLQLGGGVNPFLTCGTTYNVAGLIPDIGSPADGTSATYKGAFDPNIVDPSTPSSFWTYGWTNFAPGFCCN